MQGQHTHTERGRLLLAQPYTKCATAYLTNCRNVETIKEAVIT